MHICDDSGTGTHGGKYSNNNHHCYNFKTMAAQFYFNPTVHKAMLEYELDSSEEFVHWTSDNNSDTGACAATPEDVLDSSVLIPDDVSNDDFCLTALIAVGL